MPTDDPISVWIKDLRSGEDSAAQKIWNHFVGRLYQAVRSQIRQETRRVYDEEDAAQSAFHSLCAGIAAGRFPDLNDGESLWRLLLVIASRKVAHRHRYDEREQRDIRRTIYDGTLFVNDRADYLCMNQSIQTAGTSFGESFRNGRLSLMQRLGLRQH
jgi:DNA-directed RNA polymerase specialized sigma24 family protein